jgi:Dynein heavy chain, N-terminal region 2
MIESRVTVYSKLIEFYDKLQKQVHSYMELKRLEFTRFFFLNDSQFLDFLMQVSSNLDFSLYFNTMFRGAAKLFLTQIKQP